jgi:hypothetical protein
MKKAMGLRGATDAMDYCKSMNSKVGSMLEGRKFAEGGATESCGPGDGGCKSSKAARKNRRREAWHNFKEGVDKVKGPIIGAGLATAALIANKKGLFGKEAKEALGMKKGGSVKKKK